jgi:predicted TIM-barrel fold metal-dependent hydrolase
VQADDLLLPWWTALKETLPGVSVFDAHSHVGTNDPSGFRGTIDDLLRSLEPLDARAAVFPLKEPSGYREPNRAVIEAAEASEGKLVAFARLDPADSPGEEAERSVKAGARGLKLHPDGDEFAVDDPRLSPALAIADERRLPVMVHAAVESPGVGRQALTVAEKFPNARFILAHAAIADLSWLWRELDSYPNIYIDTSWWNPSSTIALFARVAPGRILHASDVPYASAVQGAICTTRCAIASGLSTEQIESVLGGQFERILAGEDTIDLGPPVDGADRLDPMLERAYGDLLVLNEALQRDHAPGDALDLARCACRVTAEDPLAEICGSIDDLLDLYAVAAEREDNQRPQAPGRDVALTAAVVARTPGAPLP